MCYSAEVSGGTFAFVALVATFLWRRNRRQDRPIALILLTISLMQLLELGLWLNLDCRSRIHTLLSDAIPVLILAQPILINAVMMAYPSAGYLPTAAYGAFALVAVAHLAWHMWKTRGESHCVVVGKGNHLEWGSVPIPAPLGPSIRWVYFLGLVLPILSLRNTPFALLYMFFSFLSVSRLQSVYEKGWPSVWCHFVNFLSVFALFT